ncbi:hypothetical protein RRG08_060008 [Elysia crispata]|uniref:Uncharacterized protein n=1 Tax=Elysia crispata TaxID=231223 RepID=A0AAE0YE31_9GAST|nr:hypothetical protein RRG08_060008 [Elysia crispata]
MSIEHLARVAHTKPAHGKHLASPYWGLFTKNQHSFYGQERIGAPIISSLDSKVFSASKKKTRNFHDRLEPSLLRGSSAPTSDLVPGPALLKFSVCRRTYRSVPRTR